MVAGRGEWARGRCLGRGSTATVYLAASTSGEQEAFAVKAAELSRSAPLQREQKILSSLCSSHVVSCLGADVTEEPDGRVLYNLLMEYVPGGSLAEAIKQHGGLDERTVRVYTRGVLDGLAYLHSRGIVHCDVKAHNILLVGKDDGSVKLADLGCARWVDNGSDDRVVISGTPLYMAPEVARGEEQGPAADIWALGCSVIEMVTGCPPWRDVADPVAAIHRIAFSDDVPEFPSNVSDEARDFLGRCLNRDSRKRWSAEELLNHPFVKYCCEEFATGRITDQSRTSPKSTLDHGFWDSWQDEEDDEARPHMDNEPLGSAQERLRLLVGGGVSPPPAANATWDESCWVTIRNSQGLECPSREDEASTSSSWLAEIGVDGVGGTEESAAFHNCSVVKMEGHRRRPFNTSLHPSDADVNTFNSTSVGDRNDLVEYLSCSDVVILQENFSDKFVLFNWVSSYSLFCSCHLLISPLGCVIWSHKKKDGNSHTSFASVVFKLVVN